MFGGVTHLNLDPKNRIAIPTKYREELFAKFDNKMVITLESPKYLLVYPENNWKIAREKIQNLPTSSHPLVKSYQRLLLGYAETVEVDKSGRVLISGTLKTLVNLGKDVVLAGLGNRFELWNQDNWEAEVSTALSASRDDLANLLNGLYL